MSAQLNDDDLMSNVLRDLYASISFDEGGEPDWAKMEKLFSPHAKITRITPEATDYLNFPGFRDMARDFIELGAYTSFYEVEIARRVQYFGSTAQVWSAYETKQSEQAAEAMGRGVNSIQLIKEQGRWLVLSLLWDETLSDTRPTVDQLFAGDVIHG